jgi:sec-independent protein translocase protein TatB
MIDFSWEHIVILLGIALVVLGPKDLPRTMHMVGRWMGKARAMANEFRKSFDEMARQGELDELRAEIESLRRNNPITQMQRSLEQPATPSIVPAEMESVPEPVPEPRAGEFEITDKPGPAEPIVLAPGGSYEPPP